MATPGLMGLALAKSSLGSYGSGHPLGRVGVGVGVSVGPGGLVGVGVGVGTGVSVGTTPTSTPATLRLLPHARPPVRITDRARFERLVTRAFSMRRKTLRNSLRGMLDATDISAAGIDPGLRPEQLGLADFAALAERLG